ncbi:MAG TPA: dihydroorotate dehydrogenase (quinone), partial [Coxiellaceae bacterium]|nr:dihydroorotate dehydrogenase (quinone) [Coxiellaceae bacterium]
MYSLLRKVFFRMDPEQSHRLALWLLSMPGAAQIIQYFRPKLAVKPVKLWGLNFPNPVGLAAGLDKDGECIDAWFALGFGFVELGTVTPKAQAGNPKPRLFRITKASAIINRMGFNNQGVDHLVEKLKQRRLPGIVGVNIGKNKDTPLEQALEDYQHCFGKVYEYADYVTINISSPNTPGLRELQSEHYLNELLAGLKAQQLQLVQKTQRHVPLLVKIAPDLNDEELYVLLDALLRHQIDGVIATNTTLDRRLVTQYKESSES